MMHHIPDKLKDQHIIVDQSVISRIVSAAALTRQDRVLEIGGGPGNLTKAIAVHAGTVYTIEKDPAYISGLKRDFSGSSSVRIIEGDALSVKLPKFNKIVSNPPYKILQPLFFSLLHERKHNFSECVTTAPYGFSKLASAKPGLIDFGVMSAFFYGFYDVEVIAELKNDVFKPEPRVTSCILKIKPKAADSPLSSILRLMFLEDGRKIGNTLLDALWNNGRFIFQKEITKNEARGMLSKLEHDGTKKQILEKHILQLSNGEIADLVKSILNMLQHKF